MEKTSTPTHPEQVTKTTDNRITAGNATAGPRPSTLARLRQFARAYTPCPLLHDAPGFVLN